MPANAHSDFLAYMIGHCTVPDDQHTILQLFRKLGAPTLKVKRRFFPPEEGKPSVPDAEVVPVGHDYWMSHAYQTKIHPHLDVFGKGLALIVTAAFEEARALLLMYGKAGPKWDPISSSRGSVSSRAQDFLHNGFSVLIDAGADVLHWANEREPKFASSLIAQWIESSAPILQRLAISGMTGHLSLTPDEKLSWVISNRVVEDVGLKNETFALLAEVYGASSEKVRAEFLAQAEAAMNPEGEDYERYEFFNLLSWLHVHAPECTLVTEKLHPIQERHPQWKVREHPDFNSWISGGAVQAEPDSPIPASQIAEMNLEALLAESARLADVRDRFGDPLKGGFLQEIARTAAGNFAWSEGIAQEALARTDVPVEIWSALLRGWSANHSPAEWRSLLATVERLEPVYSSVLYELSSLLKGAVERKEDGCPSICSTQRSPERTLCGQPVRLMSSRYRRRLKTGLPSPSIGRPDTYWISISRRYDSCGRTAVRRKSVFNRSFKRSKPRSMETVRLRGRQNSRFGEDSVVGRNLPGLVQRTCVALARDARNSSEFRTELGRILSLGYLDASNPTGPDPRLPPPSARDHGSVERSVSHVLPPSGRLRRIRSHRSH